MSDPQSVPAVVGGESDDILSGTAEAELISGEGGNDTLTGGAGDTLDGGAGDDLLKAAGAGALLVHGGSGNDTLSLDWSDSGSVLADGAAGRFSAADRSLVFDGIERIDLTTGAGDDTFLLGAQFTNVSAGDGNDFVRVGAGYFFADGGNGLDSIVADFSSADWNISLDLRNNYGFLGPGSSFVNFEALSELRTGSGNDTVITTWTAASDSVWLGAGNDVFTTYAGRDFADGGVGTDSLNINYGGATPVTSGPGWFAQGASRIDYSGFEKLSVNTGSGADSILTGDSADTIRAGAGNDVVQAGGGDDVVDGGLGDDVLDGGDGIDTLDFHARGYSLALLGVVLDLAYAGAQNIGQGGVDTVTNFENVLGSIGNDVLRGTDGANLLDGGPGDDLLDGRGGADTLIGGTGNDIYYVDDWRDLASEGIDGGTDEVRTALGTRADLRVFVIPDNIERLAGLSTGDQAVRDNALDNVVAMGAGSDLVVMDGGGTDSVSGGGGNDYIYFGSTLRASDRVDGGAGSDTLALNGDYGWGLVLQPGTMTNVETLVLFGGDRFNPHDYSITLDEATLAAGQRLSVDAASLAANETLTFFGYTDTDGAFDIAAGGGGDLLVGGFRNDTLSGGGGNDRIYALDGADVVEGGAGDDILYGNGGDDRITGGAGSDTMMGGYGRDLFVYASAGDSSGAAHDVIYLFEPRMDRIDLPVAVTAWNGAVTTGLLDSASLDAGIAGAVDPALGPNGALLFRPDSGDLAGHLFLIVDGDGDGAYTAGADFLIEFVNPVEDPSVASFLV